MATTLNSSGITMGSATMTVSGSAPCKTVRAQVNMSRPFSSMANYESFNVSSVGYTATGQLQINYSTALPTYGVVHISMPVENVNGTGNWAFNFGGSSSFGQVFVYERGALTASSSWPGVVGFSAVV